jgi:hypothetical protein
MARRQHEALMGLCMHVHVELLLVLLCRWDLGLLETVDGALT